MGGYLILKSSCLTRVRLKTLTCVTVEASSCSVSLRISASFSDRAACSVATLGPPSLPWNRKFMDTEHVFCISPSISCFCETLETCQRWLTIQTFSTLIHFPLYWYTDTVRSHTSRHIPDSSACCRPIHPPSELVSGLNVFAWITPTLQLLAQPRLVYAIWAEVEGEQVCLSCRPVGGNRNCD